jgi:predicted nuclease of predicted toxin-antitoxin system
MKLLLDQNLSRKLVKQIEDLYPESCHLTSVLSEKSDDRDIWLYAKENGFVIITKDDDFEQTSVLLGHPPKVIWVRLGNCRTSDVVALIRKSQKVITAFAEDEEKSILPLP